jgi:hypothetical protein
MHIRSTCRSMLALALQANLDDVGSLIGAWWSTECLDASYVPYVRTLPADGGPTSHSLRELRPRRFINFARSLVASSIHRPFLAYAHEWYVLIRSIDWWPVAASMRLHSCVRTCMATPTPHLESNPWFALLVWCILLWAKRRGINLTKSMHVRLA